MSESPSLGINQRRRLGMSAEQMVSWGRSVLAGAMARREHRRARAMRIAEWSSQGRISRDAPPLSISLPHVAQIMNASHILVVCQRGNEPICQIILWSNDECRVRDVPSDTFGTLVAPSHAGAAFAVKARTSLRAHPLAGAIDLIDPSLGHELQVQNTVTAPFHRDTCRGRIFISGRSSWSNDDVNLAKLIALRVGIDLEEHSHRSKSEAAAVLRERARIARDLHDSVLQGLAAASVHLSLSVGGSSMKSKEHLEQVRDILSREAGRIRSIVDETRPEPFRELGRVWVADEIERLINGLAKQWACDIEFSVLPNDLCTSQAVASGVSHVVMEAISNAVRHGRATKLKVAVQALAHSLVVSIEDNGVGFGCPSKALEVGERVRRGAAPVSLSSRIEDMGGALIITSTQGSTQVRVELPS